MKNFFLLIIFLSAFSCDKFVDKPKNLVDKDKMADVLVEMVINDQIVLVNPAESNAESGTRFILKKYGVSAKQFSDSYEYYSITKEMEQIIADAQKKLVKKYPESEDYINKKLKESPDVPAFAR